MIDVKEATRLLLDAVAPLDTERVALDRARGRVLAEKIDADRDSPPTDRSAMDGFAVRAADLPQPGGTLRIAGEVRAGQPASTAIVNEGQAVRIYTGAPIPPGADAVIMVELTQEDEKAGTVTFREQPEAGQHIRRQGEDLTTGSTVMKPGRPIGPAEIAALASVGCTEVPVHRLPRVSVLPTGDEIVEVASDPAPHQVRNSNAHTLIAQLDEMGIAATRMEVAGDTEKALDRALAKGLQGDVLLITGGVSVGAYDLVGDAVARAGMEKLFHGVAMKPGKPILAGRAGNCLVLGLPGNPVSAFTGFAVLAAPALRKMMGLARHRNVEVTVTLAERFRRKPGRATYHLASVQSQGGNLVATPVKTSGSGDVTSMVPANAFVITEPGAHSLDAGSQAPAILWSGFDLRG